MEGGEGDPSEEEGEYTYGEEEEAEDMEHSPPKTSGMQQLGSNVMDKEKRAEKMAPADSGLIEETYEQEEGAKKSKF